MPEIRVVVSDELDRYMDTVVQKGMFGSKAELIRAAVIRYVETLPIRVPSGYDDTTVFSPDGRIFQIEYAIESVARGATIVGLRYHDGVILAKERPESKGVADFPYIVTTPWERYQVDQHIGMVPAGLAADFILLKNKATEEAQEYRSKIGEPISVEELTIKLALLMHSYTTKKDMRPLGCVLLIGGVDKTGCRLFVLDPSGTYKEVLAGCHGSGFHEVNNILKDRYSVDIPFKEALGLTVGAVLREETRKPEEIAVAVIEAGTKTLRKVTLEELREVWKTAFKKKEE